MTFSSKLCVMLQGRIQYIPQMSHQAPDVWWSRCLSQSKWPSKTQTHTYIHTGSGLRACINMCSHTFQMVLAHMHTHRHVDAEMYVSSPVALARDIFKCLILMQNWNKAPTFWEHLYLFSVCLTQSTSKESVKHIIFCAFHSHFRYVDGTLLFIFPSWTLTTSSNGRKDRGGGKKIRSV